MSGGDEDVDAAMSQGEEEPEKVEEQEEEGEEEDDPIVAEYDVYVANRLVDNLHLFQFPMRQPGRNYNLDYLQNMRMQLGSKRFELAFNTNNNSQSIFEAPQDDKEKEGMGYHLTSTRVRNKTNYAVGVVRGNMLHMTGLSNIHQFRPNVESNIKSSRPEAVEEEKEEKLTAQQQAKLDQLQKQYEGRLRSVWLQEQEQDSWVEMGLSTANNPESKKGILERLFATNEQVQMNPKHTTNLYLNSIFKKTKDAYLKEPTAKVPLAMACDFDWRKQVQSLMLSAKIMRFSRLKSLLVPQKLRDTVKDLPNDAELLACLESCAVSIRGLFIVKSSPEYAQPVLAMTREWVLLHFWKHERVKRSELSSDKFQLPVPPEVIKAMMSEFAVMEDNEDPAKRRWVLKHGNKDTDILEGHPAEAKKSDQAWETKRVNLIQANVTNDVVRGKRLSFEWAPEKPEASRQVRLTDIENWIISGFGTRGVWNPRVCLTKFKEYQRQKAFSLPDDTFLKLLRRMTLPFNDSVVLRKLSLKDELEIDTYRPKFIQALTEQATWTRKDLDAKVGDVPRHHAEKILMELATRNGTLVSAKAGSLN